MKDNTKKTLDEFKIKKNNININICVIDEDANLISDHPDLTKFYEEAYDKLIEHLLNLWETDKKLYNLSDEEIDENEDRWIEKNTLEHEYIYQVISLYLNSLKNEKYLYVYDYQKNDIIAVWLDAVQSTDVAESNDRYNGMKLYQKMKNTKNE